MPLEVATVVKLKLNRDIDWICTTGSRGGIGFAIDLKNCRAGFANQFDTH